MPRKTSPKDAKPKKMDAAKPKADKEGALAKVAEPEAKPEKPAVEGPVPPPERVVSGKDGGFGVASKAPLVKRGERMVRLKNLRNKWVDVNLDHETYCEAAGRCVCAERDVVRERRMEKGSRAQVPYYKRIRLAKSIRIPPLGISEPLHEAVTRCPDVEQRLRGRPQKLKVMPA